MMASLTSSEIVAVNYVPQLSSFVTAFSQTNCTYIAAFIYHVEFKENKFMCVFFVKCFTMFKCERGVAFYRFVINKIDFQ